jgi:hypothetical protein
MSATSRAAARSGFVPAVVVGLALTGFIAFVAYVVLSAYEADFRNGNDGRAHALSKSAIGFAGVVQLLGEMDRPALVARGDITGDYDDEGLMVLTLPPGVPAEALWNLPTTRTYDGPVLAILPKWVTVPTTRPGWVRKIDVGGINAERALGDPDDTEEEPDGERRAGRKDTIKLVHAEGAAPNRLTFVEEGRAPLKLQTGEIDRFQSFAAAPGWTPLVVDNRQRMVLGYRSLADGQMLYALSEPDLLNNHGLADLASARAGLAILAEVEAAGPVYFDVTLNGLERSRSALKLILEPPFLPATLCVLAAALLMIWHAAFRFGEPARDQRAFAFGKQALADNQAGLIRMAGREPRMARRYADLTRKIVAAAIGAPKDADAAVIDAALDRQAGKRTHDRLSELRARAEYAKDNTEMMNIAERLYRWRLEMTRERE